MDSTTTAVDSERALLGAVLLDPKQIPTVRALVAPEDLEFFNHGLIMKAVYAVDAAGSTVDVVTVRARLTEMRVLDRIGGAEYLTGLADACYRSDAARDYARTVIAGRDRRCMEVAIREAGAALDRGVDPARVAVMVAAAAPKQPTPKAAAPGWPTPLADEALTGLAGDFVRLVLPQTESDPAVLLFQFLTAFGSSVGRTAHFVVGADRHYARLFSCVVGATGSGGRKGTSWGFLEHVMRMLDPGFEKRQLPSLASGEGLIAKVRDPGEGPDADPGVAEKRLLIRDGEFARVLEVMRREGNPLSSVLRDAWDDRTLSVPTRKDPLTATGTHISVVAHITPEELKKKLSAVEMFNGFGNRFLWICSCRSQFLPSGGDLDSLNFSPLVAGVRASLEHATRIGRIRFSRDAEALFAEVYPALTDGREGLVGAVTARADAYVRRLALLYALLARRSEIGLPDMQSALAAWRYCEDSAAFLFGGGTAPDRLTGRVLAILGDGLAHDRRSIHRALGGHTPAADLDRVRDTLVSGGQLRVTTIPGRPDGGRPGETWAILGTASKTN